MALYGAFVVKRFLASLSSFFLSFFLSSSSPLFDPPEACRTARSALTPFVPTPSEPRRAQGGSKAPPLGGGSAAARSHAQPALAGEHGEYGEHPPFDAPEHGARLSRDGHKDTTKLVAAGASLALADR
jgi:hypothetical protein